MVKTSIAWEEEDMLLENGPAILTTGRETAEFSKLLGIIGVRNKRRPVIPIGEWASQCDGVAWLSKEEIWGIQVLAMCLVEDLANMALWSAEQGGLSPWQQQYGQ